MQHLQSWDNARRVPRQVIQYHKFDYVIWKTATQKYTNNGRKLTLVTLGGRQKRKSSAAGSQIQQVIEQRKTLARAITIKVMEMIALDDQPFLHSEGPRVPTADRAYWTPATTSRRYFSNVLQFTVLQWRKCSTRCVCVCVCWGEIMSAVWAFFQGVDRRYAKSIMQHLQSWDRPAVIGLMTPLTLLNKSSS